MIRIAILAVATAFLAAGCETPQPPRITEPLAVGTNQPALETAIEASLKARDWKTIEHTPGRYVAKIDARDHRPVVIAVTYDARTYAIDYVDDGANAYGSRNDYVQGTYKRWIVILHKDIEARLR
jgi:hypothetical protein